MVTSPLLANSFQSTFEGRIIQGIFQDVENFIEEWNTNSCSNAIKNTRCVFIYNEEILSCSNYTLAYETLRLLEAHKLYDFTRHYFKNLWTIIKTSYTHETDNHSVYGEYKILNHPELYHCLGEISETISKVNTLLLRMKSSPETSAEERQEIDRQVSKLNGKISKDYEFKNNNDIITLNMLVNKEHTLQL